MQEAHSIDLSHGFSPAIELGARWTSSRGIAANIVNGGSMNDSGEHREKIGLVAHHIRRSFQFEKLNDSGIATSHKTVTRTS
jgi:hypothetical protein